MRFYCVLCLEKTIDKERSEDHKSLSSHAKDLGLDITKMKNVLTCRNDKGQVFALDHFESNMENGWRKGEIKVAVENSLKRGH